MESKDKINNKENEHNNLKPSDFQDLISTDDIDLTGYKEVLREDFIKNKENKKTKWKLKEFIKNKKIKQKLKEFIKNKEINNFQNLAPIDNADLTGYKEALDHAFNDDKIKNIAITGSYGSGKSSILNTYKKNSRLKFIHVSFLHFKECDKNDTNTNENKEKNNNDKEDSKESKDIEKNKEQDSDNKDIEKNKEQDSDNKDIEKNKEDKDTTKIEFSLDCGKETKNEIDKEKIIETVLERKIINHIINQIPFKYISDTNFNVRGNIGIFQSVVKVLFGIAILYVILFFTNDNLEKLFGLFKFIDKLKPYTISIYILLYCSIIYILIYSVILFKKLRWKNIFKKLNFKNIELDLDKLSNNYDKYDSFFDRYLNEILYVFENCKADVIVFEDIDRFEMKVIFERLREINTLLNEKFKKYNKKIFKFKRKNKIIRFCYLIRDDIFNSDDRVKLFDFMVPIMPVMNNLNVYDMFKEHFIEVSKKYNISINYKTKQLINESSRYITNMRILKNICNEFVIYIERLKINSIEINHNKILALIIYKNLFPKDFNKFNVNDGFLFNMFRYSTVKINIVNNIEKKLKNKKNLYDQSIKSIFEKFEKINNKKYDEIVIEYIKWYIFSKLLDKIYFKEDKSLYLYGKFNSNNGYVNVENLFINENKKTLDKIISEEVIELGVDILKNEYNIECIKNKRLKDIPDNLFKEIFYNSIRFINHKFSQREYDFLIYLIENFIDERSIVFTIDNIEENTDNKFLLNIFIGKKTFDFNYKLIDVEDILLKCNYIYYIGNECVLNFYLLDKLLNLFNEKNEDGHFISLSLLKDKENRNKLMYFIEQLKFNFEFVLEYLNRNKGISNNEKYSDYIKNLITELKVKFIKILNNDSKSNNELLNHILTYDLYMINSDNIKILVQFLNPDSKEEDIIHKNYSLICEHKNSSLYKNMYIYIHKNIFDYLFVYVYNICKYEIYDYEDDVIDLINLLFKKDSDIVQCYFQAIKMYFNYLKTKIKYTYKIGGKENGFKKEIYKCIFRENVVNYYIENIFDYYKKICEIDYTIVNFINKDSEELRFYNRCSDYDIEEVRVFLNELKNDYRINENKRIEIQSCIDELDKF